MAKLVLHVGAHKTGTTYLQYAMHANRKLLAQHGLHYPDMGENKAHHVLTAAWLDAADVQYVAKSMGGVEKTWDRFVTTYSQVEGTVFVSAEAFSRAHPQPVDMAELAQRLSAFEEVQVLYTVRQQPELAQSLWLQIAKSRRAPRPRKFVEDILEKRRWSGVWLDHNLLYDHLLKGFAPDQIHLLDYEALKAAPGGIVGAFLQVLDCPVPFEMLEPATSDGANVSPQALPFMIASQVNAFEVPPEALVADVTRALNIDPSLKTNLLRRSQWRKLAQRFKPNNKRLVERIQPFQPGFTFQDVPMPSGQMFLEDISAEQWMILSREFYARAPIKPKSTSLREKLRKARRAALG